MIDEPVISEPSTSSNTSMYYIITLYLIVCLIGNEDTTRINVPQTYSKDFNEIKSKFASLFFNVTQIMKQISVTVDDLKFYLCCYFSDLEPQLTHTVTIEDVMKIVRSKCTLIDITVLQAIVDQFNIEEAKSLILAYNTEIVESTDNIALSLCFNKNFRQETLDTLLICDTVQFVLQWSPDEHTLSDIKSIMQKAFEGMAKKVQILTIGEGSVKVTCYAPDILTDVLVMKAQVNAELLKGCGMVMLAIGHHIIFNVTTDDEVS